MHIRTKTTTTTTTARAHKTGSKQKEERIRHGESWERVAFRQTKREQQKNRASDAHAHQSKVHISLQARQNVKRYSNQVSLCQHLLNSILLLFFYWFVDSQSLADLSFLWNISITIINTATTTLDKGLASADDWMTTIRKSYDSLTDQMQAFQQLNRRRRVLLWNPFAPNLYKLRCNCPWRTWFWPKSVATWIDSICDQFSNWSINATFGKQIIALSEII